MLPWAVQSHFQLMAQDMDMMQEVGANALRTCHYPNDERFLDLCDERESWSGRKIMPVDWGLKACRTPILTGSVKTVSGK